jgi:hypothetical protein
MPPTSAGGKDNIAIVLARVGGGGSGSAQQQALVGAGTALTLQTAADGTTRSRMGKLVLSLDGVVIKEVQITKDKTTLGRRPYNDIVIDNLAVSGEHAVLQMVGRRLHRRPEQHQRHLHQRQGDQEAAAARTTTRSRSASTRSSTWSTMASTTRRP